MVDQNLLTVVDLVPIQHSLSTGNVVTAGAFSYLVPPQTDDLKHDYVCLSERAHRFLNTQATPPEDAGNATFIG